VSDTDAAVFAADEANQWIRAFFSPCVVKNLKRV